MEPANTTSAEPAETAISLQRIHKSFRLPHERQASVKSLVLNFYRRKRSFEKQKVLMDISFEVKKGEFFGIRTARHR